MKYFLLGLLFFIYVTGCESGRNYEEANKYFYDNEESFNRIEQMFSENNLTFGVRYYYYPITDKKYEFEVWVKDSAKVIPTSYYLPANFNSGDSSFISLQSKLKLDYSILKELTSIMIKIHCNDIKFEPPGYFSLDEIIFKKDGFYGDNPPENIKGKWYYYYKPMF